MEKTDIELLLVTIYGSPSKLKALVTAPFCKAHTGSLVEFGDDKLGIVEHKWWSPNEADLIAFEKIGGEIFQAKRIFSQDWEDEF